jgi:hypothetical protein
VLLATAQVAAAQGDGIAFTALQDGAPAPGVSVVLEIANQGKVNLGTTDAQGQTSFALDVANLGKVQVEIVVEDCPADDIVHLLGPGGQLPPERDECKRRRVGVFWWGKARAITVDVTRGTLTVTGGGVGKAVVIGGAGGAALLTAVALGGGSGTPAAPAPVTVTPGGATTTVTTPGPTPTTSTPAGSYNVIRLVIVIDVDGHAQFVNLTLRILQVAGSGPALMLTGDGNWQPIQVNIAPDGTFSGEGRGTFAGRTNVPFQVSGTLNTSTRRILLRITIGGGTLPGRGNDITYEIELQG